MPWKPPSVNDKGRYGYAWQKQRAATIRAEPLCRLCLMAGRTVPATIVDHIKPLEDGGTNAQTNLQPLCKRCHDAIKTPSDVNARSRAATTKVKVIAAWLDVAVLGSGVLNQRALRRLFASSLGWNRAHALSLAALDGIIAAMQRGEFPKMDAMIVTDDARWARAAARLLNAELIVHPIGELPKSGERGSEQAWLLERYGNERDARADFQKGCQPERGLID